MAGQGGQVRLAVLLRPGWATEDAYVGAGVFVVDDDAGYRTCVRRLLELEGFTVVGEAADGSSALGRVRDLQPAIALIDVHLPDIDGVELATRVTALPNAPLVVLMSSYDSSDVQPYIAKSGAKGFVPKDELSREAIEGLLR
jgi:DNA-binding NarL/FixJ family response regulator